MKWLIFNNSTIKQYTKFIELHPCANVWHQPNWLDFQLKSKKAYDGFIFGIEENDELVLAGVYLTYKTLACINYGYIPAGFLYTKFNDDLYNFLISNLNGIAKSKNIIFTQIDSVIPYNDSFVGIINSKKSHVFSIKAPIPQYTNLLNLKQSEAELLDQMKHKGRYNIKLASKKDVKVIYGDKKEIEEFYNILKDTSQRDKFNLNTKDYYLQMLESIPNAILLKAVFENKMLAAGIFIYTKNYGLYYYGASSNEMRNLMAPYLLQWEAIRIARQKGCIYYDFMGIADPNKNNDSLAGVTDFKLKFGENIVQFNPSYHIVHNKINYLVYKILRFIKRLLN